MPETFDPETAAETIKRLREVLEAYERWEADMLLDSQIPPASAGGL